jgi:hypothetical protein
MPAAATLVRERSSEQPNDEKYALEEHRCIGQIVAAAIADAFEAGREA